jgi:hypothetical protein
LRHFRRNAVNPGGRSGHGWEAFAARARTAAAALALVAVSPSRAEAEQIRIVHLSCEQWYARQAMLAERAAWRVTHPVQHFGHPAGHARHRFKHHGPRIHFVCDCVDGADQGNDTDNATDGYGGGLLPQSNGYGGSGDVAQFSGGGGDGFGYAIGGGGGFSGGYGGGGVSEPFAPGSSTSGNSPASGGSFPPSEPVTPPVPDPNPGPGPIPNPDPGPIPAAPEPSTWILFGLGAGALAALKLRRRKAILAAGA